jgi:hypothetical protein
MTFLRPNTDNFGTVLISIPHSDSQKLNSRANGRLLLTVVPSINEQYHCVRACDVPLDVDVLVLSLLTFMTFENVTRKYVQELQKVY